MHLLVLGFGNLDCCELALAVNNCLTAFLCYYISFIVLCVSANYDFVTQF